MSNPTTTATARTAEPPEHLACRTNTAGERRGVEAALNEWRLGDSNWRNIYVGNRHVGVSWVPGVPELIAEAMNAAGREHRVLTDMVRVLVDEQLPTEPGTLANLLGRVLDGTYDPRGRMGCDWVCRAHDRACSQPHVDDEGHACDSCTTTKGADGPGRSVRP